MQRIYTRTGDGGMTSLYDGQRIPKFELRMEVVGSLDELNAALGAALVDMNNEDVRSQLNSVQNTLFNIGAEVAEGGAKVQRMIEDEVRLTAGQDKELEAWIDAYDEELTPLSYFILPGGCKAGAQLHLARTICRRAERTLAKLAKDETVNEHSLVYINRLSDLLFVMARAVNSRAGVQDTPWDKNA